MRKYVCIGVKPLLPKGEVIDASCTNRRSIACDRHLQVRWLHPVLESAVSRFRTSLQCCLFYLATQKSGTLGRKPLQFQQKHSGPKVSAPSLTAVEIVDLTPGERGLSDGMAVLSAAHDHSRPDLGILTSLSLREAADDILVDVLVAYLIGGLTIC